MSHDLDGDPQLICPDRYWRLRLLAAPTVATALECARWLRRHVVPEHSQALRVRWGLGYGFITSDVMETTAEIETSLQAALDGDELDAGDAFFGLLYVSGKARAGFRFQALAELVDSSNPLLDAAALYRNEPIVVALRAMAAFGRGETRWAITLLGQVWSSPPEDREVVDMCLNGLAAAPPFAQQAPWLRTRAADAVAAWPEDHVFHGRLAIGRRLSGDYEGALNSIDKSLALLPATGTRLSHQLLRGAIPPRTGAHPQRCHSTQP